MTTALNSSTDHRELQARAILDDVGVRLATLAALVVAGGCWPSFDLPGSSGNGDGGVAGRFDASSDGGTAIDGSAQTDGASAMDASPPSSCFGDSPGAELYATTFADLGGWAEGGLGFWVVLFGEALQSDNMASVATQTRSLDGASDYRVVSLFRSSDTREESELGLIARKTSDLFYFCNFKAHTGHLEIELLNANVLVNAQESLASATTAGVSDYRDQVVMELEVQGDVVRCCVNADPSTILSATNSELSSGGFGIMTRESMGAFASVTVYAPGSN